MFNNVTITEKGVNTTEFLDAAAVVVQLFDILGNKAFSVVQNDLLGNIKVSRCSYLHCISSDVALRKCVTDTTQSHCAAAHLKS